MTLKVGQLNPVCSHGYCWQVPSEDVMCDTFKLALFL